MIFFFGTRPGTTDFKALPEVDCPYCGQSDTLTFLLTRSWFHIFWIPIFTISKHSHVECAHCKRVYDTQEFTSEMRHAIEGY